MDAYEIMEMAMKKGVDEVSVILNQRERVQVRYSNSRVDIINNWVSENATVYLIKGKRVLGITVTPLRPVDEQIDEALGILRTIPENPEFAGLNDKKQTYSSPSVDPFIRDFEEVVDVAREAIEGARRKGVSSSSGVVYHNKIIRETVTPYNSVRDEMASIELTLRAKNEEGYYGTAAAMYGTRDDYARFPPGNIGEEAASYATMATRVTEGEEGKYDILMHPLCFASLISHSAHFLSALYVDSGMSMFTDMIGKEVASEMLTVHDDSLMPGSGHRVADEEGTATKRVTVIERGVLRTYLHNNSTAKKFKADLTGHAGIISPTPWQLRVEPGRDSYHDLLGEMKRGLFIVNTWYTRFQDYRNGIFSTIPRDGMFYVEDGEIVGAWKGIRISDSMLGLFRNVESVSSEVRKIKWWDETLPLESPYVLVRDVNITRSK